MSVDKLIDALGQIDEDMVQKVEKLRSKRRKPKWVRWTALAAGLALMATLGWYIWEHVIFAERSITLSLQGIYVNSILYMPDIKLEQEPTQENVGEFIGYVSIDNQKETRIKAYRYIPEDGETSRIIVPYSGDIWVYKFCGYSPDGTDEWPSNLLKNAVRVEIRDVSYGVLNETVYLTISEGNKLEEVLLFLTDLKGKRSSKELGHYYYGLFKDRFSEGEISVSEAGKVITHGNAGVDNRYAALIRGKGRHIAVIMKDNTELTYIYQEGAGVIVCDVFGYILSQEQVEQINQLVGLE